MILSLIASIALANPLSDARAITHAVESNPSYDIQFCQRWQLPCRKFVDGDRVYLVAIDRWWNMMYVMSSPKEGRPRQHIGDVIYSDAYMDGEADRRDERDVYHTILRRIAARLNY